MSVGLGINIQGKNLCYYYPERKGLIISCTKFIMIIIGAFISVYGEKLINPSKIVLKKGEIFYPLEISINYIKFYKIALFIIPITSLLSACLVQKHDQLLDNSNLIINQEDDEIENKKLKNGNYAKNFKASILNNPIWNISFMAALILFSIDFSESTFRVYGALVSFNGTIIQYSSLLIGLAYIIFEPLWGIIYDKFSFNITIKIICICSIIHSAILSIFIQSNLIYFICILIGSIIISGFNTVFQSYMMKIYGMKYFLEIGGILGITSSIFNIFKAILSFLVSKYYNTGNELQIPYRIIYIVGIFLAISGFCFGMKENDNGFVYPFNISEEDNLGNINPIEEGNNNYNQIKKMKNGKKGVELEMRNYKNTVLI